MERRKKEDEEIKKRREQKEKLIHAFRAYLRTQRLDQWSEFVQSDASSDESYVSLKEFCGEKTAREVFQGVLSDLERDSELCCKAIRRIFQGQTKWPLFEETKSDISVVVSKDKRKTRSAEAKTLKDLTAVFDFHIVKDAYDKELTRSRELEKKKAKEQEESKKMFINFLASIYDDEENVGSITYEDAKKRLGHRSAWENVESSEERRVLFDSYMKKFATTTTKTKEETTKPTKKKRKRSEDEIADGSKKTMKSKGNGGVTWESIQEAFPKKITVVQLKALCVEKGLDTSGKKADLLKRVKGALN